MKERRRYRWRNVSMVFQSAMSALNPVMRVGDQFVDMMKAHERVSKRDALRAGRRPPQPRRDRPRPRARVPARALRRHASARDHRDGARARAGARDHGRADDRARRRRAARDPAGGRSSCSASSGSRCCSSRTTCRCCSSSRTGSRSCTRARSSSWPSPRSSSPTRCTRTPLGLLDSFPPLTGPIEPAGGHPRQPARPRRPADRVPLPPALPALPGRRRRAVRAPDHGAARAQAGRVRPRRRLSSRRGVALVSTAELDVRALTKDFGKLRAVDDVSFTLRQGTITALVGESGSGKSTVARILARLHDATSGSVIYDGTDVLGRRDVKLYRSRVQMIFQDPFDSLNPVRTIGHHLERPVRIHSVVSRRDVTPRVHELLRTVGLVPPEKYAAKYPHELSGGPAAARRDRARARGQPVGDPRGRADLDARRLDPDRDPQPDARAEAGARDRVPLHHARHRERALHRGRGARDVRRPDRRAGPDRFGAARAAPPVHEASALRRPAPGARALARSRSAPAPAATSATSARERRSSKNDPTTSSGGLQHDREDCVSRRLRLGCSDRGVPDRGRRRRGRPRREHLGPVLRDAGEGAERRERRDRVRLLPPVPRRRPADERARARRVPPLDRVAADHSRGARAR